jgi:hypothetical protein
MARQNEDELMSMLMGMSGRGTDNKIKDFDYIREVLNRNKLGALQKGDLIVQIPDSNGN